MYLSHRVPIVFVSGVKWARDTISAARGRLPAHTLKAADTLASALDKVAIYLRESAINPLLPCLVLNYFAIISSGLYLLEHAAWAIATEQSTSEVDVEAFRRWIEERDLAKTESLIQSAREEGLRRAVLNSKIVFGSGEVRAAKL